jgi:hypothetical protein
LEKSQKKLFDIVENPYYYKPMRNVLKGKRRVHIESFVIIFAIKVTEETPQHTMAMTTASCEWLTFTVRLSDIVPRAISADCRL